MCSITIMIREMQIKTTNTTLHLLEWVLSKREEVSVKDVEKRESWYIVGGNMN